MSDSEVSAADRRLWCYVPPVGIRIKDATNTLRLRPSLALVWPPSLEAFLAALDLNISMQTPFALPCCRLRVPVPRYLRTVPHTWKGRHPTRRSEPACLPMSADADLACLCSISDYHPSPPTVSLPHRRRPRAATGQPPARV